MKAEVDAGRAKAIYTGISQKKDKGRDPGQKLNTHGAICI